MPSPNSLAFLLAALAVLGPFSVATYLPAFPRIQATLQATPLEVQQTLTAYMFAFASMMLFHGALSDALGRRNIILGSLSVFAVASLGCAAVHSVEYLWAFRVLQGVSAGAGIVIGRAMIRDLYSGAKATRLLSLVTMIFSIGPAIAPILGGWIVKFLNWRSIFLFLFCYTVILLALCYRKLPETLAPEKRQVFDARVLLKSYMSVFSSLRFQLKAGVAAFIFAGVFLYIAAAPVFLTEHLGLGPDQFAWLFIPMVGGVFLGALAANRMAGKISIPAHVAFGFCFLIGASVANLTYHAFLPAALPWSVAPLFFYAFGFSFVMPVLTLMVIDLFPDIRGMVASCQVFTQTMLGAFVAGVIAPSLSHNVVWLAAGQLGCAVIALGLWTIGGAYHSARKHAEANAWEAGPLE